MTTDTNVGSAPMPPSLLRLVCCLASAVLTMSFGSVAVGCLCNDLFAFKSPPSSYVSFDIIPSALRYLALLPFCVVRSRYLLFPADLSLPTRTLRRYCSDPSTVYKSLVRFYVRMFGRIRPVRSLLVFTHCVTEKMAVRLRHNPVTPPTDPRAAALATPVFPGATFVSHLALSRPGAGGPAFARPGAPSRVCPRSLPTIPHLPTGPARSAPGEDCGRGRHWWPCSTPGACPIVCSLHQAHPPSMHVAEKAILSVPTH